MWRTLGAADRCEYVRFVRVVTRVVVASVVVGGGVASDAERCWVGVTRLLRRRFVVSAGWRCDALWRWLPLALFEVD